MKLRKAGAMVPMARGARTEPLVVFFCSDWEELVCLLEAPLEYLRGQQFCWEQDATDSISWQLLTPVTATIECGLGSIDRFQHILAHLGPVLFAGVKNAPSGDTFRASNVSGAFRAVRRYLQGSFFVEFATYTNAIRVFYIPKTNVTSTNRYLGGFTNPQLMTSAYHGYSSSSLHFDLDESSARMRADFIVNLLEAPDDITSRLTSDVQAGNMTEVEYALDQAELPRRHLFPISGQQRRALDPQTKFKPGHIVADTADRQRRIGPFDAYHKYPTVIAHNLSEPIEASVCSVIKCPTRDGHTIGTGVVTVESYFRMLYDPQSVIERYA